jgi:hypothetical protein
MARINRPFIWAAALWLCGLCGVHAAEPPPDAAAAGGVIVYGQAGGGTGRGWAISASVPAGWVADCCNHAKAIGVNLALFQGPWTGKPDGVILLTVWPVKRPTLQADMDADLAHYRKTHPAVITEPLAVSNSRMTCQGVFYLYHASGHADDVAAFCDPGTATGIRLSWSMSVASNDPRREALLTAFRQVVGDARYMELIDAQLPATDPR